jgi:hypothetical protein
MRKARCDFTGGVNGIGWTVAHVGVVGGIGKLEPILEVLCGKLVNVLVTDSIIAQKVLDLSQNE